MIPLQLPTFSSLLVSCLLLYSPQLILSSTYHCILLQLAAESISELIHHVHSKVMKLTSGMIEFLTSCLCGSPLGVMVKPVDRHCAVLLKHPTCKHIRLLKRHTSPLSHPIASSQAQSHPELTWKRLSALEVVNGRSVVDHELLCCACRAGT